ncbi:MAG: site-specific integrase [Thiothrix sp.]|nr:MAG: site-specific integrase [Thiothrix sp.]
MKGNYSEKTEYSPEMRIFDTGGNRLYLNQSERERFLEAAKEESRENHVFCHTLHYTGCRPTEALELSASRVDLVDHAIVFRSLKKRRYDNQGRKKKPAFRSVAVPERLIDDLDLVFDLRTRTKDKSRRVEPLWSMGRQTAWRVVGRVMARAGIVGPQATSKGLRHAFGVSCVMSGMPLHKIAQWLGHTDTKTTEIYTTIIEEEDRGMLMRVWE